MRSCPGIGEWQNVWLLRRSGTQSRVRPPGMPVGYGQLRDAHHERRRAALTARMYKPDPTRPDPTLPRDQQDKRSVIPMEAVT